MSKLNIFQRLKIWWYTGKRAKYVRILLIDREFVTSLLDAKGNPIDITL